MAVVERGVRDVGYTLDGKFVTIPEMIPELVVPDLTDFKVNFYYVVSSIYLDILAVETICFL